jgi:hypothetical protein
MSLKIKLYKIRIHIFDFPFGTKNQLLTFVKYNKQNVFNKHKGKTCCYKFNENNLIFSYIFIFTNKYI